MTTTLSVSPLNNKHYSDNYIVSPLNNESPLNNKHYNDSYYLSVSPLNNNGTHVAFEVSDKYSDHLINLSMCNSLHN